MPASAVTDPRVLSGMTQQLALRAARLAAGASHLGWKAGFGAPAALERFALAGPLMGYLLQSSVVASGTTVSLAGWTQPVGEPEIAIYLGRDLPGGGGEPAAAAAIAALGPAIELADLDPPPDDVAAILAGNIYHRHVLLGPRATAFAGGTVQGLSGVLTRAGSTTTVTDLQTNTGRLTAIVAHLADTLAASGEMLKAGDVIIAGSVTPPLMLTPHDARLAFALTPIGEVAVDLSFG